MGRGRVVAVALVLLIIAGTLVYRLVDLQITPDAALAEFGTAISRDAIPAPRGQIVDRDGRPLAMSLAMPTVLADPRLFDDAATADAVARLGPLLSTDDALLTERLSSDRAFAYLERQVDPDVGEAVDELDIPGVWVVDEPRRENPNGECSAMGVVGRVDTDHAGISGLEMTHDEQLRGVPGELIFEASADGASTIPGGRRTVIPPEPGDDLRLTLDRNVQYRSEQLLVEAAEASQAGQATVIVGVPSTGEIISMASVTAEDETGEIACTTTNHAATWSFEPGSIIKPLTVSGVIAAGVHDPNMGIEVPGWIERGDHTYKDHWPHDTEIMSLRSILANSSNIGTILLAEKLGADGLFRTFTDFGLGTPTALALPGEASGILDELDTHVLELSNAAIGQSVAVTPIQMHQAFGAIANGGVLVDPTLIDDDSGAPPASRRAVSEFAADAVMEMMGGVVTDGTGTRADVPGYHVAGKTGTAWAVCADTGTYWCADGERHFTASFVGIVSNDDGPVLTITVVIDDAKGVRYSGGSAAAPLFADLADYSLRQLRIPPSSAAANPGERVRAVAAQVSDAEEPVE